MKIYTKAGDHGQTSLLGGDKVHKGHSRIALLGAIDELNSALGLAVSLQPNEKATQRIERTQRQLFSLGAELARLEPDASQKGPPLSAWIEQLEQEIDQYANELSRLTNFILPGGSPSAAAVHFARSVCRRVERAFFAESISRGPAAGIYLNRLGDWLFMLARQINLDAGRHESIWTSGD